MRIHQHLRASSQGVVEATNTFPGIDTSRVLEDNDLHGEIPRTSGRAWATLEPLKSEARLVNGSREAQRARLLSYCDDVPRLIQINDKCGRSCDPPAMNEMERALNRWKAIYDELVRTGRELAALPPESNEEAAVLRARIVTLVRESNAALDEMSRYSGSLRAPRQHGAAK